MEAQGGEFGARRARYEFHGFLERVTSCLNIGGSGPSLIQTSRIDRSAEDERSHEPRGPKHTSVLLELTSSSYRVFDRDIWYKELRD
jgi:hypothetical protein